MSTVISFDGVSKTYSGKAGEVRAVRDVSLDVEAGEIFGVIGWSGAGKSTLVRLVNGLEPVTSGRVRVLDREISGLRERQIRPVRPEIGMIFQQFNLFNSKSVAENIAYPLRLAGWSKERRTARVKELLDFVGLADKERAYPDQLSGGQKQRVGIARALAPSPRILLADECTSALDPETTREVLALLRRINDELGLTIVLITHEMDIVKHLCDRVAVMEHGEIVETGAVYDVFADPQHETTRRFVATSLRDQPRTDTLRALRETHPGAVLTTVAVREERGSSALIAETLGEHPQVRAALVYGGITDVGNRPLGSLTFALTGTDAAIEALVGALYDVAEVTIHVPEPDGEPPAPPVSAHGPTIDEEAQR
ncbi:methionine ABC transporter ATP-binding protein [Georgenia sp. Z1344]|uniref:methionine ABC transporter ATP-binding protein n=1 Tax=Georgenia sp. Z1344 TaxID=3416706 RepID=UPI003CEFEE57